jgi:hypothetical protein
LDAVVSDTALLARALGWVVGPAIWLLIVGAALLGQLVFGIGGRRAQVRRLAVLGGVMACVAALVVASAHDVSPAAAGKLPVAPADPRVAAAVSLDGEAAPLARRVVTKDGHPTHPTWYHDSQVALAGGKMYVAFNARNGVRVAELRASDLEILAKVELNTMKLGGSVDSTGTDTDRHDVPTVVSDGNARLHFLYGGGSLGGRGDDDGPLHRATLRRELASLSAETPLALGGAVAFDFEAVTDRSGVRHVVGQYGRGDTGSLVELRLTADGRWLPHRRVIAGGYRRDACVLDGQPRGCNRFAIARMASGPDGRLHLVWGYSEASLGGKCQTDQGYCDHDLFYAVSVDGGATWRNADLSTAVDVAGGRSIRHDDPAFRIVKGAIGLYKAVVATAAGPVIVHTEVRDDRATVVARRLVGGRWFRTVVARPRDAGVRSWSGAPVLRVDGASLTMWIPTGDRIFRFSSPDSRSWRSSLAYRGAAWSLTGIPSGIPGQQVLVWRGAQQHDRSEVVAALMPVG